MAYDSNDPSKQYLRMKIESATPIGLVVILYDGGIKFIKKALVDMDNKSIMGFVDNVVKAQNILRELRDSLDMSIDQIAPQLRSLYTYMLKRLIVAAVEKTPEPAQEVLKMMESLRGTWDKVRSMAESGQIDVIKRDKSEVHQHSLKPNPIVHPQAPSISLQG
ncbi:MAG: flagellar export chaperone FliS [Candidatus Auribacterota bacterium]|jgi:flagellar protein FliS|nr:flagellar export chaperone FliS [Candidatus Auribacterota bacterium]